jgi:lipopolysaccharide/colanic/teichoic acid biosynthesis glycosyltransferase/glycosyltransferase involved in cell wall biosynthesis
MGATAAIVAVLVLGAVLLSPYLLYGPLLRWLAPRRRTPARPPERSPPTRLSVLIPACNEAAHIRGKVENTLSLGENPQVVEILVRSDGSSDGTDAIVREYAGRGVQLTRNEIRLGKPETLNRLVADARGDLLLITDASARLSPGTLGSLLAAMEDPEVGLACPRYVVLGRAGAAAGQEASYWGREQRLRALEAERDMLIGVSGAAYLVRRELMPWLALDTINDDFVVPIEVRLAGSRVAFCGDAMVSDEPTGDISTLYRRWRRIAFGNYQMLWRYRRLFWRGGRLAVPLIRKALKTAGPLLLVALVAVALAALAPLLPPLGGATSLGLGALLAAIPFAAARTPLGQARILRFARFALVAQAAYLDGAFRFITGLGRGVWHRPDLVSVTPWPRPPWSVRASKRALDLTAATLGLALVWPLMVAVAVAVRLGSPGPILYRQDRLRFGRDGAPHVFWMLKFRTMRQDAEEASGAVWAAEHDARITGIGGFLRAHRIDELPQLFNILLGDMTLVGPRPERPTIVVELCERVPGYRARLCAVRPGITGWAQVVCGYDTTIDGVRDKLLFDLSYVGHLYRFSTWLRMETRVLFRTVGVVWHGKGAH